MTYWVAGSMVVSAVVGAASSNSAANKQAKAGQASIDTQRGMFDTTQDNIRPFLDVGQQYAGVLSDLGKTDYATRQFGPEDLKAGLAPNYDWIKQQGLMAANNAASAQGGVAGTGGQRAAIDYAEGLAGNAYQNAFLNFNNQRNNIFSNLNSIASLGSNAAVGQGNIAANVGGNIGNTMTGIGNAQAGGIVGGANAISGGLGNYLGYNYLANLGQPAGANTAPAYDPSVTAGIGSGWKPADYRITGGP